MFSDDLQDILTFQRFKATALRHLHRVHSVTLKHIQVSVSETQNYLAIFNRKWQIQDMAQASSGSRH